MTEAQVEEMRRAQTEAQTRWFNDVAAARQEGQLADWQLNHCLSPDNVRRWWPLAPGGIHQKELTRG